ncbi:hypothetical protein [Methanoculleus sp.]|uniref:hypothetical protein n=1 Tax=Methanoculleus sp. TaxID=90427 RepID=UPI001BD41970|nr:hypothetical protein [Methanoculleus sp.]
MKRTIERRVAALEQAADPDAGTPLILFGDDPEPAPTRRPRRVIHFDEEDRHL